MSSPATLTVDRSQQKKTVPSIFIGQTYCTVEMDRIINNYNNYAHVQ